MPLLPVLFEPPRKKTQRLGYEPSEHPAWRARARALAHLLRVKGSLPVRAVMKAAREEHRWGGNMTRNVLAACEDHGLAKEAGGAWASLS